MGRVSRGQEHGKRLDALVPKGQRPVDFLVIFGVPLEGFASEAGFGGGPRRDCKSRSPAPRAEVPRGPSAAWSLGFGVANPGC